MLELKHIIKKYDDKVILNDISLAVKDGEIISILGPSGGGKTTLLNVILGITPISSGQIVYDGNDLTHVPMQKREFKSFVQVFIILPMFLPTLTYGFAVIHSLGKQGLITKLVGGQLFSIYGFWGLLISYVIYTLPPAFILLYNAFKYVDKHFIVVSQIMGDSPLKTFYITSVRPMMGTIAASFILSFFLSFTDFGIPASIGIWPM